MRLEEALWTRIALLDEMDRALLELVAVGGAPLPQESVAHAAGVPLGAFIEQVGRLRSANLAKTHGVRRGDPVEPYHDRVREAVLAHLSDEDRARCHRRLALALEASATGVGADPEALAAHWEGAGDRSKAASYSRRAADEAAAALAFDRAARLYRRSLTLRPPAAPTEEARLRTQLGDALANAGRGREAAEAYLGAVALSSGDDVLHLHRRAADQLLRSGHIDEGVATLRTVLGAVGARLPESPRGALASLLWSRARLRLRGLGFRERAAADVPPAELLRIDVYWSVQEGFAIADTIRGADFQTRGLLAALEAGEPYRIARALGAEAAYSASAGGEARERTARLLAEADALAQRIEHPHALGVVAAAAGLAAFLEGRWRDAAAHMARAEEIFPRCTDVAWEMHTAHLYGLIARFYLGELEDLSRLHAARLREAEERGNLYAATTLRTALPQVAWLVADQADVARRQLAVAARDWSRQGFHLQHYWTLLAAGHVDLYTGANASAHARVRDQWPALDGSLLLRIQVVRVEALWLRARSAIAFAAETKGGERARLLALAERDAAAIAGERMPWSDPIAALLQAAIAHGRGDDDGAAARLAFAATGFQRADMALLAHAARWARARVVGGAEGHALAEQAARWLTANKVASPAQLCAMLAPGFGAA